MGNLVCSNCGRESYYNAYRGSKLSDQSSPCCKVVPAQGKMVNITWNDFSENWRTETQKIYIVNGKVQFSRSPIHRKFYKDDGEHIWFIEPEDLSFRPNYVPENYVSYVKINKETLIRLGWKNE